MPRKPNKSRSTDFVSVKVKINGSKTLAAAQIAQILQMDAGTATIGFSAQSQVLANYMDMYRYFRVDNLKVHVVPLVTTATTDGGYIPFVIAYLSPNATTAPTTPLSFETPHQVLSNYLGNRSLKLNRAVLKTAGSWAVTQGDVTDEIFLSFGDVWIANSSSDNYTYIYQIEATLTFRQLLDPGLISQNLLRNQHPAPVAVSPTTTNGFPPRGVLRYL